jgi:hypothetical protein
VVQPGHVVQGKYNGIYCKLQGYKNQDKFILGTGSARVITRHGDNHFWVIRRHEFSGDDYFCI